MESIKTELTSIQAAGVEMLCAIHRHRMRKDDKSYRLLKAAEQAFERCTGHAPSRRAESTTTDTRICGGIDNVACTGAFLMTDGSLRYWKASMKNEWLDQEEWFHASEGIELISREYIGGGYEKVKVRCREALFPIV